MVLVFERVHDHRQEATSQTTSVSLADGSEAHLNQNEWDAYQVFGDLCAVTSQSLQKSSRARAHAPRLLKITSISTTFGLELIESILSGFANGFRSVSMFLESEFAVHQLTMISTNSKRT